MVSKATPKMRRTLGAMDLECEVNAHQIAKTLRDQFEAQQIDLTQFEGIDGIGTLRMPVVAEEEPTGLTGAQLPPVKSYRKPR